jgi:hypothetical protein
MLRQLLVGTAISVCNIAIHALVMATVVHMSLRMAGAKDTVRQSRGCSGGARTATKKFADVWNFRNRNALDAATRVMFRGLTRSLSRSRLSPEAQLSPEGQQRRGHCAMRGYF